MNLGIAHLGIARILADLERNDEAETAARKALAVYEKLKTGSPDSMLPVNGIAAAQNRLGLTLNRLGRGEEAEKAYRVAMAAAEKLLASSPDVAEYNDRLRDPLLNLGHLLAAYERHDEADRPGGGFYLWHADVRGLPVR